MCLSPGSDSGILQRYLQLATLTFLSADSYGLFHMGQLFAFAIGSSAPSVFAITLDSSISLSISLAEYRRVVTDDLQLTTNSFAQIDQQRRA